MTLSEVACRPSRAARRLTISLALALSALTITAAAAQAAPVTIDFESGASALGTASIRVTGTVHGHTTVRFLRGRLIGSRFASLRRARLVSVGHGHDAVALALRVGRHSSQGSLSIAVAVMRHGRLLERATPVVLSGGSLRSHTVRLTLPARLHRGRDKLVIELLETSTDGMAQGSVLVSRRVAATAR